MRIDQIEFPGRAPLQLDPGLTIIEGLSVADRRRWIRALTSAEGARLWIDGNDGPLTELRLPPDVVAGMVFRERDLVRPPLAVDDPAAFAAVEDALAAFQAAHAASVAAGRGMPVFEKAEDVLLEAAQTVLQQAREELAAARAAQARTRISADDIVTLDRLHNEVMRLEKEAMRRLSRPQARRELAAARDAESEWLERLGFGSYTSFLLDYVAVPPDSSAAERVHLAEVTLAEADESWRAVRRMVTRARRREAAGKGRRSAGANRPSRGVLADEVAAARRDLEAALKDAGVDPGDDAAAAADAWLALREEPTVVIDGAEVGPEQLELYLLGRLAAQRNVAGYGRLPLIVDNAFAGVLQPVREQGLGLLERMSTSVQVIVLFGPVDAAAEAAAVDHEESGAAEAPAARATEPKEQLAVLAAGPDDAPAQSVVTVDGAAHRDAGPAADAEAPAEAEPVESAEAEADRAAQAERRAEPEPAAQAERRAEPEPAAAAFDSARGASAALPPAETRDVAEPAKRCASCLEEQMAVRAAETCGRCRRPQCDVHVIHAKRSSKRVLCVGCAMAVAGAATGRRR